MKEIFSIIIPILAFLIGSGILIKIISLSFKVGEFVKSVEILQKEIRNIKENDLVHINENIKNLKVLFDEKIWKELLLLKEKMIFIETKINDFEFFRSKKGNEK